MSKRSTGEPDPQPDLGEIPGLLLGLGKGVAAVVRDARRLGRVLRTRLRPRRFDVGVAMVLGASLLGGIARPGMLTEPVGSAWATVSALLLALLAGVVLAAALLGLLSEEDRWAGAAGDAGQGGGAASEHARRMDLERQKRRRINQRSIVSGQTDPLDGRCWLADELAEIGSLLPGRGVEELVWIGRVTRRQRVLKEIESWGEVRAAVRTQLALPSEDLCDVEHALDDVLGPFEYHHVAIPFALGGHDYLVLVLAKEPISDDVALEASCTATRIGERHVAEPRVLA